MFFPIILADILIIPVYKFMLVPRVHCGTLDMIT